jgi:hypothetical protein
MKEILRRQNSLAISLPFICKFLLLRYLMSAGNFQGAVADESGIIRNQMETHNGSEMVAVQGLPYAPTSQG